MGNPITKTPRTNAAAKRALVQLTACNNADDFKILVKRIVQDLLNTCKELESELEKENPHNDKPSHGPANNPKV